MNNEELKIIEKAVDTFGNLPQIFVSIEEMGELIQALSKNFRGKDNIDNIAEEITDVEIMLNQLKYMFKVNDLCDQYKKEKLEKLNKRISGVL